MSRSIVTLCLTLLIAPLLGLSGCAMISAESAEGPSFEDVPRAELDGTRRYRVESVNVDQTLPLIQAMRLSSVIAMAACSRPTFSSMRRTVSIAI